MLVQGKQLFDLTELQEFVLKFQAKIAESKKRIVSIQSELQGIEAEIDSCLTVDILEDTVTSKKDLSNVQARKQNLEFQLEIEEKKEEKIQEVFQKGLADLITKFSLKIREDLQAYQEIVEKEFYRRLAELREQQEEILLLLALSRNQVLEEIFQFDTFANLAGMRNFRKEMAHTSFHCNMSQLNRSLPEYGVPLLAVEMLPAIEDILSSNRTTANAEIHHYFPEKKDLLPLPPSKIFKDVNLQEFLDSIE